MRVGFFKYNPFTVPELRDVRLYYLATIELAIISDGESSYINYPKTDYIYLSLNDKDLATPSSEQFEGDKNFR